jgi:hypothetical protein
MKTIAFITIISFGFLFTSFKNPESICKTYNLKISDSIPEMNQQIIDFVRSKIKTKVGRGECWDLAVEALKTVNAAWDMKYDFGREINYKKETVFPGDIIQFENVILKYEIDGKKYTEKMTHHTGIIFEVRDNANFIIAHQNNGYSGKKVGLSPLDLTTLTKGKFKIYRPEKLKTI